MGFSGMMGSNKAKNQKRNPTGRTGGEPVGILQGVTEDSNSRKLRTNPDCGQGQGWT